MAYFLKVSKQQTRTYLSIYESFYSDETKGTKHKCYKHLGNIEKLKKEGIEDPIAYYKEEVKKLNEEKSAEKRGKKIRQITEKTPVKLLGYFPLANIMNALDVEQHFDLMQSNRKFDFNVFKIFSSLVYARVVAPCSKSKTFHDVLPNLVEEIDFSYDQILKAIEFVGADYKRFVEIFTEATKENFGINTSTTYFDCTNFYFEIDRESGLKQKGPCKHNSRNPIVGMGLLLDKNMLPVGMKIYPGNESEKPLIRDVINDLKSQNKISGRTVQVADKGLNCSRNIIEAVNAGDGYLFSKSVRMLPQTEKDWVLIDKGYEDVLDKDGHLLYKFKECCDEYTYEYTDDNGKKYTRKVKEKRVVTYNPSLAAKRKAEIQKLADKAQNLVYSKAKKSEAGPASTYINFLNENGEKASVSLNQEAINNDLDVAGFNMLVTSEITMSAKDIYNTYHNLWRIEETFRTMKTELEARPVYLQKDDRIKGHFLICYVSVLLTRIFQFNKLKNEFGTQEICEFFRTFTIVKSDNGKFLNISKRTRMFEKIAAISNQPILNYYLTTKQVKRMLTR